MDNKTEMNSIPAEAPNTAPAAPDPMAKKPEFLTVSPSPHIKTPERTSTTITTQSASSMPISA